MAHNENHEALVESLKKDLKVLYEKSPQAIYAYLDDEHKFCNAKFAEMVGYKNPEEWSKYEFPVSDVVEEDQEKVIHAYMHASRELYASSHKVTIKTKKGKELKTEVIMVPFPYKEEVFVLHFISQVK